MMISANPWLKKPWMRYGASKTGMKFYLVTASSQLRGISVAKNPRVIKSKISFKAGKREWLFASSDRADVMFEHNDGCVAVEVKALEASNDELERGIYQCVKYQALLRAELKAEDKVPNGLAVLVIERQIPSEFKTLPICLVFELSRLSPLASKALRSILPLTRFIRPRLAP